MKIMHMLTLRRLRDILFLSAILTVVSCKKEKDKETEPPAAPKLSSSKADLTAGTDASEQVIEITANMEWTVTIPAEASEWLSADKMKGNGNASLKFILKRNENQGARTAVVVLKGTGVNDLSVSINQKGLVEWRKILLNYQNSKMVEATDGYVIAGSKQNKIYVYKVSKTDFTTVKEKLFDIPGYIGGFAVDLENLPGGGFVLAAAITENTSGSLRDTYLAQLTDGLEVVKEKIINKGTDNDGPNAICPTADGYTLAGNTSAYPYIANLDKNFDAKVSQTIWLDKKYITDLKVRSNGEIIAAGYIQAGKQYLQRFTATLNEITEYISSQAGIISSIVVDPDNSLIVGGHLVGSDNKSDIYCGKFDLYLNRVPGQELIHESTGYQYCNSLIPLKGGGYALSGSTAVSGDSFGYSIRVTNELAVIPGKEVWPDGLFSATCSVPLEDGGYLVTGFGTQPSQEMAYITKVNP